MEKYALLKSMGSCFFCVYCDIFYFILVIFFIFDRCFKIFDIAHAVTVTPAAVMKSTKDVISEFANDGVVYLELRTTPRSVPGVMSKKQYIQAVIDTIK